MTQTYPKHIYEPIRIKIATDYVKKELRKYLPTLKNKTSWIRIDNDIDKWFTKIGPRDFWNGFHGICMGFKLKHHLTHVLTAENIHWQFEKALPVDKQLSIGGNLSYISEKLSNNHCNADEIRIFFENNKMVAKKWRKEFEKPLKLNPSIDNFPIIVTEEEENGKTFLAIHDGNRRTVLSILQGKDTISAYVGKYKTKEKLPKNFWLPTSFLMDLVYNAKVVGDYDSIKSLLKSLMKISESGEYELKERVLIGNSEFRIKLEKDLWPD